MANQEYLEILRQGVEAWNTWREEHPSVKPNLRHANLEHTDYRFANFWHADLQNARQLHFFAHHKNRH